MKKIFGILGICIVVLLATGVLAETVDFSENVEDIVKNVAEKKGVDKSDIKNVKKVDFNDLPDQINIETIDDTNLAMYEIDVGEEKPVYVITVSEEAFEKIEKIVANKMLLNFGYAGEFSENMFLESAVGVKGSLDKGYVMMRDGSITGISTNLEILDSSGLGEVEIIIYKNGEEVGFRNTFSSELSGVKSDYDVQSEGVVAFEAGDVISVYAEINGNVETQDVTTLIEITVEE